MLEQSKHTPEGSPLDALAGLRFTPPLPGMKHPLFDLQLHSDSELEGILGAKLTERRTLHEWPLSCVQLLVLDDGRRAIYKSQAGPTLEDRFYLGASSPLLPNAEILCRTPGHLQLLLEHIEAPHLASKEGTDAELLARARELTDGIRAISGEIPCFRDLGSPERWSAFVDDLDERLERLSSAGKLTSMNEAERAELISAARAPEMLAFFSSPAQLLHSDLKSENIFELTGGYKVIDWQFPRFGPPAIDHAIMFDCAGRDAAHAVGREATNAMLLMRIEWFAQCSEQWLPGGSAFYDQEIAKLSRRITGSALADGVSH